MSSKQYPFTTRKQIVARIESEPAFVTECAVILESRTRGRAAGVAPVGKAWGFMSSERIVAGRLTELARTGTISDADMTKLRGMVARYAKQIADHFREIHLRDHPELIETARLFSVAVPGGSATAPSVATVPASVGEGAAESSATEQEPWDETATDSGTAAPDLVARVLERVREQPGSRTEEMAAWLGATTADVGATVRSLIGDRKITKKGKARGTRYFAR